MALLFLLSTLLISAINDRFLDLKIRVISFLNEGKSFFWGLLFSFLWYMKGLSKNLKNMILKLISN
jgi:hypothetical protein